MIGSVESVPWISGQYVQALVSRRRIAGVVQIHQHEIEFMRVDSVDYGAWRGRGMDPVSLRLQKNLQRFQHIGLVVRDQDLRFRLS